ncbi:MAG: ligase-associated DNA damage response DEXH box helicase [Burkholderiaceae bacterium]|nr:ligase-associated DNA damage response DEXH box helicase [Burkholderiaceae bacterium]
MPAPGASWAEAWFTARGWQPFAFQREVWAAMAAGRSGLLHATTGSGKTYAVWFGALLRGLATAVPGQATAPPLGVLWLTPMRALAADTTRALQQPLPEVAPRWSVGQRTGDTASAERARQDRRFPTALVTTPESLSLMLTRERAAEELAAVHTVIVDEWHELMGNKRGVQVQLALARLRRWNPRLVVWGLSATLGNLDDAKRVLMGGHGAEDDSVTVQGRIDKALLIDTLLPENPGRFSWGGHLGAQMLQPVIAEIDRAATTLVFTNTRSQAEIWYQLLLRERPDWAGIVALHHGSLDKAVREWVEAGLKQGQLKAVVCTSSLDLGVDFLPVERVLQIGSAKGVARLLQRAGRSGHAPGRPSRVTLVPTNTLELVEAAAARRAALAGRIERRASPDKPLDVLVQHLVTVALGGGFAADALYDEVCSTHAYRALGRDEFDWALGFVEGGGGSLTAYPDYHRVQNIDGLYRVPDRGIAKRHRLAIGTIVSDAAMQVKYRSGGTIGSIEESFIARLRQGDCFVFAGRVLEYLRTQDMTAYVQRATKNKGVVPSWAGGKMPLSSELADAVLELLAVAARADGPLVADEPEMRAALPMLQTQVRLSVLPTPGRLLVEVYTSREGHHLYLYPFAGRNVHLGLASLLAWRLAREAPNTFSVSVNDYGFELLSAEPVDLSPLFDGRLFDAADWLPDVLHSLNSSELAQRRFREIARVAGLVFTGYPGAPKSTRQLQVSSSLFFEVFKKYDAGNLLLTQAQTEVLSQELDIGRLRATLQRLAGLAIERVDLKAPSPFSLPLMVERLREKLSTEKLADRLARIVRDAERAADKAAPR